MLYVAFVRSRRTAEPGDVHAKSDQWWNQGECPEGLTIRSIIGTLGTGLPNLYVFEATEHSDISKLVRFWSADFDIDVYPAVDLLPVFREQGMNIG